jgi:hypothetical protein
VRLTPHFTMVHDLHPGILSIVVHSLLISWFTQVGNGILRKRTIAPPWAIVHRTILQSAQPTEEANDRTSWGDRSLPRQAHKGARSSPARAHTNTQVRTFAHPWAIVRLRGRLSPMTYLGHFSPFSPITFTTMLHLVVLGWSINFFQDMCFWIQVWGYDIPTSAHSGILYPSPHFSVLYIHWGQCMIQVWGYERHIYTHLSCF